ncbi:MAG: hypothetical protein KA180_11355 [Gemmatimonadales bacterium]|jgi:hypothetical protein|nr:hypothetical protein [Gemmatimonadales bacterium]MBP9200042.1 hypothetical protein [Gemmatimonadales bacterium]
MAHIDQCIPGAQARILSTGVPRVKGRTGMIVEVSRVRRKLADPLQDRVTVDVPGHGDVVVSPGDIEIVAE